MSAGAMTKTAFGIFAWDGEERRSQRYGAIVLNTGNFMGDAQSRVHMDDLDDLIGKRVKITARVVAARESGHAGDQFLRIKPSTPNEGEVIDIGVGILGTEAVSWGSRVAIILRPEDDRRRLWIDPRILYRLHDQTVALTISETSETCHAAPNLTSLEKGAIENGDGSFQVMGVEPGSHVVPIFEEHGDGLFTIERRRGTRLRVTRNA